MDHQYRSPWISVGQLPAATSFPSAPWEQRHRDELALRDGPNASNSNSNRNTNDSELQHLASDPPGFSRFSDVHDPAFQLTAIREAELVSRCLYVLQGIPVAVTELQLLAKLFSHQVADRSLHRLSTLWQRSASTKAVGKLLTIMAQAGQVRCQLEEFVDFFLKIQRQGIAFDCFLTEHELRPEAADPTQKRRGKGKTKHLQNAVALKEEELNLSPPYSLVNQAFARSVKSILQGHLAALNTLTASVLHRRSTDSSIPIDKAFSEEHAGTVIGFSSCEMTLLELHLHTSTLRVQLQALASVCLYDASAENPAIQEWEERGDWPVEGDLAIIDISFGRAVLDFSKFPKGADLLTFLYKRLQEADSVHIELLRYLFSCACQPYLVFIQSWLYCATVKDPYKEFIVDEAVVMTGAVSHEPRKERPLTHLKVQASVSAPCFLEDICTPLLRAGQQLQVLLRLAETSVPEVTHSFTSSSANGFGGMLEGALKCWTEFASEKSVFSPILVFSKEKLEELIEERRSKRRELMQNFHLLFSSLHLQSQGSDLLDKSNLLKLGQVNAQKAAYGMDHTVPEESGGAQSKIRDMRHPVATGDLKKDEDFQDPKNSLVLPEVVSASLSFSSIDEQASGHRVGDIHGYDPDMIERKDWTEDIESEKDQPFLCYSTMPPTSECNAAGSASKQRRRWREPLEVVIVHGQSEEDVSSGHRVTEEKGVDLCRCVPYVSEYEDETDILCSRLSENDFLDSYISNNVTHHDYNFPAFSELNTQTELILKAQDGGLKSPMSQSSTISRSPCSSGFSFFFSDICLEEIGPEIFFGRSYIRKLAQKYKNSSMPQDGGYKKGILNFDAVSRDFWSFEACISNGSFDLKLLPVFPSTNTLTAVETLDLCNSNIELPSAEDRKNLRKKKTEGQLYQNYKRKGSSYTSATSAFHNDHYPGSKFASSLNIVDDVPMDGVVDEYTLEVDAIDSQKKQGISFGGATWESYLMGTKNQDATELWATAVDALEESEIPLEVIVDKCIIQEILSQYQCISHFSVRLLHEVFGLQDHLAALRRYFFMERGDWADTFTAALYHHAWYPTGSQQRQLEVQTLLEVAIQNSSCENDNYAERLRVHIETHQQDGDSQSDTDDLDHIYINKNSVSAFDFVVLGYHVEWPISLILTSESFKLYNSIFSFLVRTKLAVHALGDIWRFLKNVLHVSKKGNNQVKQDRIQMLMLFRQQIAHFITTLQGYIESQLLHNVWSKLLQALRDEGKDLQDLETLHRVYLRDASHVCFLSDEMKPVKACVDDIMQCLLNLSLCLYFLGKREEDGKPDIENDKVQSAILEAKNCYESSIQQLHQIRSNSHNQLSLSYFWTRLDFNGFLGDTCSKFVGRGQ